MYQRILLCVLLWAYMDFHVTVRYNIHLDLISTIIESSNTANHYAKIRCIII
jgi:hypothetical protein